ncbi:preprotein translocase subunit SecE [Zavarzinia sp.]|uniref:preprotein translocase subunit SecE n=1 Tax=Zavarzinia sp. TaxID=2027920 RepID=UPI003BB516DC|nr:preprotein translocase subunit SecE [Zavarzinia sp.]
MSKSSPIEFARQVRQEVSRVTWPSRKETGITTLFVFVMVVVASIFFLAVDIGLSKLVELILGFGA